MQWGLPKPAGRMWAGKGEAEGRIELWGATGHRGCACPIHGSHGNPGLGWRQVPSLLAASESQDQHVCPAPSKEGSCPRKTCLFISFNIRMEKPPSAINFRCLEKPFCLPHCLGVQESNKMERCLLKVGWFLTSRKMEKLTVQASHLCDPLQTLKRTSVNGHRTLWACRSDLFNQLKQTHVRESRFKMSF